LGFSPGLTSGLGAEILDNSAANVFQEGPIQLRAPKLKICDITLVKLACILQKENS